VRFQPRRRSRTVPCASLRLRPTSLNSTDRAPVLHSMMRATKRAQPCKRNLNSNATCWGYWRRLSAQVSWTRPAPCGRWRSEPLFRSCAQCHWRRSFGSGDEQTPRGATVVRNIENSRGVTRTIGCAAPCHSANPRRGRTGALAHACWAPVIQGPCRARPEGRAPNPPRQP
jgi:hypothetical protein